VLSNQLLSLKDELEAAARRNVQEWMENNPSQSFTITEKKAMVKMEALRLAGDLTLAEVILRGEIIREIESYGLWSSHPMGFNSMEEAAAAQGITASEYSNIRDLCDIIFPYLVDQGYNVADLWESIGKSKFRELIPILKRVITNEPSTSQRVETIFENEINDIFATAAATGENITEEAAREILLDQLLELGQLPVREMRQRIRPERTPSMVAYKLPYRGNQTVMITILSPDQEELYNRRLTGYIDVTPVERDEMRRSPVFRELAQYLRGE